MPFAPARPCTTCNRLNCTAHQRRWRKRKSDPPRGNSAERGYDRQWRSFRENELRKRPKCEALAGCNQPSSQLHHIVRLIDGGERLHSANVQAVCKYHHDKLRGKGGLA